MSVKTPLYKHVVLIGLGLLIFFFLMTIVLLMVEQNAPNGNIIDWEDAIWFAAVTVSTVGYGDLYPVTITGRLVGISFLVFSLVVYGYLISYISSIFTMIKEYSKFGLNGTDYQNHAVIIGWNSYGRSVVDQLIGVKKQVAIVVDDKNQIELISELYSKELVFLLYADFQNFELIKKCNIEASSMVFINLNDDTEKLVYLLNIKKHFEQLSYIVTLDNANLKNTFVSAGVTYAISRHEISSKLLASYMFEPDVAEYSEDILSFAHSESDFDIKQFKVTKTNPFLNKTYGEAFYDLKKNHKTILIGLSKSEGNKRHLMKNPEDETPIQLHDYLVLITNGGGFKQLNQLFGIEEGLIQHS